MKAQTKVCPSCRKFFTCNANNIAICQCVGIELTEEAKRKIDKLYSDCLCKDCLISVK